MPTISLKKGDYIRDPIYHEWRFAMVTRDVEIDTGENLVKIYAVWVDEYLIGRDTEVSFIIFVPNSLGIVVVEKKHVIHFLNTLSEEISDKIERIADGDEIIPFCPDE